MAAELTAEEKLDVLAHDTLERLRELFPDELPIGFDGWEGPQKAWVKRWDQLDGAVWSYLNAIPADRKEPTNASH